MIFIYLLDCAKKNTKNLRNIDYPGRLIIIGVSPSGEKILQLYCTMGRSENSRSRKLANICGVVSTVPLGYTKDMENTELLIYSIARQVQNYHIVSNGLQTDTVAEYVSKNRCFEDALLTWKHEHDAPIYTPRISGIIEVCKDSLHYVYKLSIIKAAESNPTESTHYIFRYNYVMPGVAHCIHTYSPEGICQPYKGEPFVVTTFDDLEQTIDYYWDLMPHDKRIGMYCKMIDISTGKFVEIIKNQIPD